MSAITKQWLQQKISDMEAARDEIPFGLDEDDSNTLAAPRIALASLEDEAVGVVRALVTIKDGLIRYEKYYVSDLPDGDYELFTAPPAPVSVPDYPETLPCPVMLEPGLRFGKGVNTRTMLGALQRRAEYHAELEAMTPEQRAEHDANMNELAAMLQGAENAESPTTMKTAPALDSSPKIAESTSGNSPVIPDWQTQAEKMAELYGSSFVLFRNGESPQCADPTKVIISFTDDGLGHGSAAPQQEVKP